MVVSIHATVANYEYLVYWRFYQDGNIECEVRATGIMVTTPLPEGAPTPPTGTLVDQRTYAPFHQHFLVARMDLDIDGQENTVMEVDSMAAPIDRQNPYGLAVVTTATPVASEAESARDFNWDTQRAWKVTNPNKVNAVGTPVAYKLVPTAAFPPMMDPGMPQYPAGAGDGSHAVGHPPARRGEVALRNVSHAELGRPGADRSGSPTTSR